MLGFQLPVREKSLPWFPKHHNEVFSDSQMSYTTNSPLNWGRFNQQLWADLWVGKRGRKRKEGWVISGAWIERSQLFTCKRVSLYMWHSFFPSLGIRSFKQWQKTTLNLKLKKKVVSLSIIKTTVSKVSVAWHSLPGNELVSPLRYSQHFLSRHKIEMDDIM